MKRFVIPVLVIMSLSLIASEAHAFPRPAKWLWGKLKAGAGKIVRRGGC